MGCPILMVGPRRAHDELDDGAPGGVRQMRCEELYERRLSKILQEVSRKDSEKSMGYAESAHYRPTGTRRINPNVGQAPNRRRPISFQYDDYEARVSQQPARRFQAE
jgi:hypothetical protein